MRPELDIGEDNARDDDIHHEGGNLDSWTLADSSIGDGAAGADLGDSGSVAARVRVLAKASYEDGISDVSWSGDGVWAAFTKHSSKMTLKN